VKAEDTFRCPKLMATITRNECYARQIRGRQALREKKITTPANDYCAGRECGLGKFHARLFQKKVLLFTSHATRRAGLVREFTFRPRKKI